MKDRIRKNISRLAHMPMERVRRRQAEQTPIAISGLHLLNHTSHDELINNPNLENAINYLSLIPGGDHYLGEIAKQPSSLAMGRRALRAIQDPERQIVATADLLVFRRDHPGIVEAFWRRRLQRQIGNAATRMVSETKKAPISTIWALDLTKELVPLPEKPTTVVTDAIDSHRDVMASNDKLSELYDELLTQERKKGCWGDRSD